MAPDETVAYRPMRRMTMGWPLMSHQEFPAFPAAAASARQHARVIALEFGLSALADNLELIVSELVTNAVHASLHLPGSDSTVPVVRLWLASDLHCMLVRVGDTSSEMPAPRDASPDDESGRGLMLVDCLSTDWGAYREECGKVVWAIVG